MQAQCSDNRDCDYRIVMSYDAMDDDVKLTPEVAAIFNQLAESGRSQKELADALDLEPNKISKAKIGERQFKAGEVLRAMEWFEGLRREDTSNAPQPSHADDDTADTVGIQHIDQAFGLGRTFTDNPVEVDTLQFPKVWVDSITSTPPTFLTWTRGRGDSMEPTIHDGDLVLLDRSQRRIGEPDALWAFTVGNTGGIKRLRIKGERVIILSDNPSVPEDWEPADDVNIVARVIFVGRRM